MSTCTGEGATRAANKPYRRNIAGADPVDLTSPLPDVKTLSGVGVQTPTNLGIQPNPGGTVVISCAFVGNTDECDLSLVNWGRAKDGTLVAISIRDLATVTAGVFTDSDGNFMGSELVEPCNAPLFEIRARSVTGTLDKLIAWAY